MKTSILIVEDENLLLNSLRKALSKEGYQVITATSGEEALDSFKGNSTDVVLLDVRLPGMDGIQVLQRIKSLDVGVPVVIMTAFSGIKGAVEAIKLGAYDYIAKPFDIEELKFVLARCLASQKAVAEVNQIRSTQKERYSFENIITGSAQIKKTIDLCWRLAQNAQSTVLIMGESGTGKESLCQGHSLQRSPIRSTPHHRQLRRLVRGGSGKRTFRPREGSLYGGREAEAGHV